MLRERLAERDQRIAELRASLAAAQSEAVEKLKVTSLEQAGQPRQVVPGMDAAMQTDQSTSSAANVSGSCASTRPSTPIQAMGPSQRPGPCPIPGAETLPSEAVSSAGQHAAEAGTEQSMALAVVPPECLLGDAAACPSELGADTQDRPRAEAARPAVQQENGGRELAVMPPDAVGAG
jgi:hypothetical protein